MDIGISTYMGAALASRLRLENPWGMQLRCKAFGAAAEALRLCLNNPLGMCRYREGFKASP